jgi:hypothetical protein
VIGWVKATVALPDRSSTTAGELTQLAFSTRRGLPALAGAPIGGEQVAGLVPLR